MVKAKRLTVFSVRFTDDELAEVNRRAEAVGLAPGQFLRYQALAAASDPRKPAQPPTRDAEGEPAPEPDTTTQPSAPRLQSSKLDALGDDPLRGGQRSSRR